MKNRPAIAGLFFCCLCSVLRSFKCLLQIGDDIVGILQTDCQTNQTIREAGGLDLFFRAHGVRHGSGVLDKRLAVAEADGQRAQMHVVEHFFGLLKAAHLEGDNTAEPRHLADSRGVMRMKQFELNRDGGKRLYQQIYAQLRSQIFSGEIAAGQPLPSYRFMSRKYQVNVATVEKAYDLLEANGYIRRCQGSGSYVLPLDNFEFFANGVVLDSFQAGQ